MSDTSRITALNRAAWDASAPHHGAGPAWDALRTQIKEGDSTFDTTLTAVLQDAGIAGARLVQLGCNNGREVFSAMALGAAHGLGIDQSSAFLAQAATLGSLSPFEATFLNADIYALPQDMPRDFDIALITIGVLNWMPDLPGFFSAAAGLLRPGGQLIVYETHPVLDMFDPEATDPHTPAFSYFRQEPHVETQSITYDGASVDSAMPAQWFPHTLGAIVQATVDAGLTLRHLREYPHSNREVDYDVYTQRTAQLPMCYVMRATKV